MKVFAKLYPMEGLKKSKTDIIKVLLALYLVLIHARVNTSLVEIAPLNFVLMVSGYLICSYFFFISGFGMMTSFANKPNYMKGFLKRQVLPLYTQYLFILIITVFYRSIILKEEIQFAYFVSSLTFGGTYVIYGWYLQVAILTYILFNFIFSLDIRKSIKKGLFTISILLYVVVCLLIGAKSMWYDSVLAVALGVLVADMPRKEKISKVSWGGYCYL